MSEKEIESAKEYYDLFQDDNKAGTTSPEEKEKPLICKSQKSFEALKYALDIRKFEIDLYWKRASYFWVLIGAALVAFIAIATKGGSYKKELCAVISSLGLVFSLAWLTVNKGSKFWQENWEKHVDMLETAHMGPLYKTVFNSDKGFLSLGHSAYSVSKVNLAVSFYVVTLWLVLLIVTIVSIWSSSLFSQYSAWFVTIGAVTSVIFCGFMACSKICRTNLIVMSSKRNEEGRIVALKRIPPLK